eukprot:scaffold724_cov333-Prasinococcus_capsulatus_cf.AAC.9
MEAWLEARRPKIDEPANGGAAVAADAADLAWLGSFGLGRGGGLTEWGDGRCRRGGSAEAGGPGAVREDLQALHQEAVGQVPRGAGRLRAGAHPLPRQHRRPLLRGPVAGAATVGRCA